MAAAEPGSGTAVNLAVQEGELLHVCAIFRAADAALDRLLEPDEDPPDEQFMALHAQWCEAFQQVIVLPAHTLEGTLAKSAVMRRAMRMVLGAELTEPAHLTCFQLLSSPG